MPTTSKEIMAEKLFVMLFNEGKGFFYSYAEVLYKTKIKISLERRKEIVVELIKVREMKNCIDLEEGIIQ